MNITLKASINSGAALLIYIAGFFALTIMAGKIEGIERIYAVALAGWTGAVSFFWLKRNSNNNQQLKLETEKLKVTASDCNGKGDPLS